MDAMTPNPAPHEAIIELPSFSELWEQRMIRAELVCDNLSRGNLERGMLHLEVWRSLDELASAIRLADGGGSGA